MRLFEKTLQGFDAYSRNITDARIYSEGKILQKGISTNLSDTESKSPLIMKFNEDDLKRYFSPSPLRLPSISIGDHPDFESIDHRSTFNHHVTSLFMDIKGSTRLIEVLNDLEEVRRLKDTILTLAINVCNFFGGHVQRLQGDGIFVLFTRNNSLPIDSAIGALNASSVLTYFIKYEMAPALREMGLNRPIRIRTGLDHGPTEEVLWSRYGIPGCDELTTTSLHTDMAAKLQQRANSNGVLIGENVRELLDLDNTLLSRRTYSQNGQTKTDSHYYVSSTRSYSFWVFDWESYLLKYSSCQRNGSSIEFLRPTKRLKCVRLDNGFEYSENSYALPKDIKLKFVILDSAGNQLNNYPEKKIKWKIVNTGKEASNANKIEEEVDKAENQIEVTVDSKYLGQHKMVCEIGSGLSVEKIEFHVFVGSNNLLGS